MRTAVTSLGVAGAGLDAPEDLWRQTESRPAASQPGPPFDPTPRLGRGLRYKDRATKLALLAADRALAAVRSPDAGADGWGDRTAIVVSSNFGNLDTVCDVASVIAGDSVTATSPMKLPNASSNVIASSIAIRHGLRGPNIVLCNGGASGLDALHVARCLLAGGRAARVLVVGAETAGAAVARWHGRPAGELFDGAVALVLEAEEAATEEGRPPLARLAACRRGTGAGASAAAVLASGEAWPSLWLTGSAALGPDDGALSAGPDAGRLAAGLPRRDVEAALGPAFGALGVVQAVAAVYAIATQQEPAVLATAGGDGDAATSALFTTAGSAS
jgi:3-oxoacyl-[acyl-carrier-protein] synthase II